MFLSKRPNGIYHIYYKKSNGRMTSVSTKTKLKSEANKFLIKFASKTTYENGAKVLPTSVIKFSKEFLKHSEAVHTYWTNYTYKQTFGFFNKYFPKELINEIGASDINRYVEYRINSASIYQARKDLINIAAAFNWAIVQGYLTENPCKDVKRIKVPQKLPLYYSQKDFNKLISVIDSKDIMDITIFAVNTGLRQMELIKLQWQQISFTDRILILDNQNHITKGKKVRTIPMNSKAWDVLDKRFKNNIGDTVFTYNKEVMSQDFLSHNLLHMLRKLKSIQS